ncbi:hypothetical protein NR402_03780, partial [Acidithiobacillus ferrooxidans]|uniref:hypothetical protein n=1 Tax=Acidithiobacillus ferrooxidans TaxID=920 RepID=UPI00214B8A91
KCGGGGKTCLVATEGGRPVAQLASIVVAMVAMTARPANNNSLANMSGPGMPLYRRGTGSLGATLCCRNRSGERTPGSSTKRSSALWWMT